MVAVEAPRWKTREGQRTGGRDVRGTRCTSHHQAVREGRPSPSLILQCRPLQAPQSRLSPFHPLCRALPPMPTFPPSLFSHEKHTTNGPALLAMRARPLRVTLNISLPKECKGGSRNKSATRHGSENGGVVSRGTNTEEFDNEGKTMGEGGKNWGEFQGNLMGRGVKKE